MPGEIIVKFKENADKTAIHNSAKTKVKKELKQKNTHLVTVDDDIDMFDAINSYKSNPDVEYAEPNYIQNALFTPNDPNLQESGL